MKLLEQQTEPISQRIAYIKLNKSKFEIPLRLKLLRQAKIPKSQEKFIKESYAQFSHVLNCSACRDALTPTEKLRFEKFQKLINRLHKQQCLPNCPWDGYTIFTRERLTGKYKGYSY